MTDAEYIDGATFQEVARTVLDQASWDSTAQLFLAYDFGDHVSLLPSQMMQTVAEGMTPVPNGVAEVLRGVAWTGREWGITQVAPPELVGMAVFVTGYAVAFDPSDVAAHDQAQSWARDRRLKTHPNRVRVRAIHIARRREKVHTLYQAKGGEPAEVDMPGGIVDGLLECAAAFVPNWKTGV